MPRRYKAMQFNLSECMKKFHNQNALTIHYKCDVLAHVTWYPVPNRLYRSFFCFFCFRLSVSSGHRSLYTVSVTRKSKDRVKKESKCELLQCLKVGFVRCKTVFQHFQCKYWRKRVCVCVSIGTDKQITIRDKKKRVCKCNQILLFWFEWGRTIDKGIEQGQKRLGEHFL